MQPKFVLVLLEPTWHHWCKKFFTEVPVKLYEDFVNDTDELFQVDVLVSDIDLPAGFKLWEHVTGVFIGRRSIRHANSIPQDFVSHCLSLCHIASGGVTDGVWKLNIYVKWSVDLLPAVANRDMSCIVNSTVGYGLGYIAPVKLTGINPKVVPIHPRTYHGAGLYPFLDRTAYYVVPSVFTSTKWCR